MKNLLKLATAGAVLAVGAVGLSAPANAQAGTQYIGQISAFGGNFCPREWANTDGQLLSISQNTALFAVIGTIYGGDGRTTMGLPDLKGRRPISAGNGAGIGNFPLGQKSGTTNFTLALSQLPAHNHSGTVAASPTAGDTNQPVRNSFALAPAGTNMYLDGNPAINNMHADSIRMNNNGGGQSVNKLSPYQVVKWCIATTGVFPSRN